VVPAGSNSKLQPDPKDSDVLHVFAEDLADLELFASAAEPPGAVVVAEPLASVVAAEEPDAVAVEVPLDAAGAADKIGVLVVAGLLVAVAAAELRDALAIVR